MTKIGIVGFGQAGSAFAQALAEAGAMVSAYDQTWAHRGAEYLRRRSNEHATVRFCLLPELLASVEVILSTVTTNAALDVAEACAPHLQPKQIFCDLNSTAPAVKLHLAEVLEPTAAAFVEGAILGAIGVSGAGTHILLGGAQAETLSRMLNRLGLNTSTYSRDIGKASAFKMLRSVFSKGLESLIIEFLMASRKAGLQDDLWREATSLMTDGGFEKAARNWVSSHAVAHERRYHEMVQVTDFLRGMQLDPIMTEATTRFFERSMGLKLPHDSPAAPAIADVVEALLRHTSRRHSDADQ